jgi:hypothetical protein
MVGFVKSIQANRGVTKDAELRESFAEIRCVIKIRILFFYQSTLMPSPAKENRQLEKLC